MTGPTVDEAIAAYDRLAPELAPRYAASGAERFVARHAALLPPPPGPVLDVGAGSGAHAAALAARGYRVVAVEPSAGMRAEAARLFPDAAVEWVDDRLPDLEALRARGDRFGFILVNAVWMHVPPADRDAACAALAALAAPDAVLSMALRQGPAPADRPMHDCDPEIVAAELARHGFAEIDRSVHDGGAAAPGASFVRLNLRYVSAIVPLVREFAARDAAARELGIEVLEARPGLARCALTIAPLHANPQGVCHGGVLFTFADSAFGYACNAHGQPTLAQAADIDFIRPGRIGERLVAVAEERARAGRSGVYDVTVATEAGEVVALFRGRSRVAGGQLREAAQPDADSR